MTYFGFLIRFLVIPIGLLGIWAFLDRRRGNTRPQRLRSWPVWSAVGLHMAIALIYTTPWDNYLVATRVWWYELEHVSGWVIGWVPVEEYTFFLLQPILAGLFLLVMARRLPKASSKGPLHRRIRFLSTTIALTLWAISIQSLISGQDAYRYLGLELAWALPPIALQLAFGADILWRYRRLVVGAIVALSIYLSAADSLAIQLGVWTIDPAQSTGLVLGGVLPVEEVVFFLLTNTLICFGIVLLWSRQSQVRFARLRKTRIGGVSTNDSLVSAVDPASDFREEWG